MTTAYRIYELFTNNEIGTVKLTDRQIEGYARTASIHRNSDNVHVHCMTLEKLAANICHTHLNPVIILENGIYRSGMTFIYLSRFPLADKVSYEFNVVE